MKLLLYVSRTFASSVLLTWFGLVVLVVAVTLVESAGRLTRIDTSAWTALRLAGYSAVEYGYQMLPVSCFLGALMGGTLLARRGELLAIYAAGIGLPRLWLAFFVVALGACGVDIVFGEWLVPHAISGIERIQREDFRRQDALTSFYLRRTTWFKDGDLLLYLPMVDFESKSFPSPTVYTLKEGRIDTMIDGKTLHRSGDGWFIDKASVYSVSDPAVQHHEQMALQLSVDPEDLIDVTGNPRLMSTWQVLRLIERRDSAGFDSTMHRVEVHGRYALPILAICLVLLAIPWALDPNRRRSLAVTLGAGVVVVGLLLAFIQVCRLLALGHTVSAGFGAWGPIIVTLALAPVSWLLYQRHRVRGAIF